MASGVSRASSDWTGEGAQSGRPGAETFRVAAEWASWARIVPPSPCTASASLA